MQAYLVIRQGSRWTDVFRLNPQKKVVIGRASSNEIVIRDDRCSRHHAEIRPSQAGWVLQDLGSRNGTVVGETLIAAEHVLQPGDVITIAECHMAFVHNIAEAFQGQGNSRAGVLRQGPSIATDGSGGVADKEAKIPRDMQATVVVHDSHEITHRREHSGWFSPEDVPGLAKSKTNESARILCRLAFELAQQPTPDAAAQLALQTTLEHLGIQAGGVLKLDGAIAPLPLGGLANDATGGSSTQVGAEKAKGENRKSKASTVDPSQASWSLLAAQQHSGKAYHRVTDFLANSVLRDGQAALARNVRHDSQLAESVSIEGAETTSVICAPVRFQDETLGLIHLYSSGLEPMLTPDHLEFTLAVAENLGLALANLQHQQLLQENLVTSRRKIDSLQQQLGQHVNIVGKSAALQKVQRDISKAGPTGATILIRGESGVGKELIAQAIHRSSPRRDAAFVCLNCAALSPTLLESELFGHEKGAFTGATDRKIGKFEAANGGTLMLDEIGEMSPEIQAKFLRALEGQPFERLGGNRPIKVDVRTIAATNRNLEEAVADGSFRADLYFRLRVIEIHVPALRERRDDIPQLAEHFLRRFVSETGRKIDRISDSALQMLTSYDWPGNIRELKNVMERAVVLSSGSVIQPDDIALSGLRLPGAAIAATQSAYRPISLDELEREHITATLKETDGNKSKTASILGIERSTLDRKLKKYQLTANAVDGSQD